jgi:hypothetical protein
MSEETPVIRYLLTGVCASSADVAQVLAARLRQLDAAELPTVEKSRLTATLTDALLRAFAADELSKRMEALGAVLLSRKDNER